jgi:cholesterol transport system auxiliary component
MPCARVFLLALAATWVSGCASLLPTPQGNEPVTTYLFAPELPAETSTTGRGPAVLVALPDARPGYATARLAYVKERYRLDYFAYHQWVDTPSAMLRPLLASALRGSKGVGTVVTGSGGGTAADFRLDTGILYVHQDFRTQPSRGAIALSVRIVDLRHGSVIASRTFEAAETAPADGPYGGVVAINRALSRILPEIAAFAASGVEQAVASTRAPTEARDAAM